VHGRAVRSGFEKGKQVGQPSVDRVFDVGGKLAENHGAQINDDVAVHICAVFNAWAEAGPLKPARFANQKGSM
jgi:hypothetical protein